MKMLEEKIVSDQAKCLKQSTLCAHSRTPSSHWTHNPINTPVYKTTNYEVLDPGTTLYEYSRSENPTRNELQRILSSLEGANYGLVFSSGMGALTTASYLLKPGQHVLCCDDVYGGTNRFFSHCSTQMGIETTFVDGTRVTDWTDNFRHGKTKMVWIESPTNPTMKIIDIENVTKAIKNIDPTCIVVVDNTFMSPIFSNPLELGADIVMHSCTKYINGHSDVMMGALITNNPTIFGRLKFFQNALGIISSPSDCFQVIQNIKTLAIRVRSQALSAMSIAKHLESHKYIEKVIYPGLKSHPQHELAKKQYSGFSGIIAMYVRNDKGNESTKILQNVKIFRAAVSLGCVCSLIQIPSLMTHSAVAEVEKVNLGLFDNFMRLSIGLEDVGDLIRDLDQAIEAAYNPNS